MRVLIMDHGLLSAYCISIVSRRIPHMHKIIIIVVVTIAITIISAWKTLHCPWLNPRQNIKKTSLKTYPVSRDSSYELAFEMKEVAKAT